MGLYREVSLGTVWVLLREAATAIRLDRIIVVSMVPR